MSWKWKILEVVYQQAAFTALLVLMVQAEIYLAMLSFFDLERSRGLVTWGTLVDRFPPTFLPLFLIFGQCQIFQSKAQLFGAVLNISGKGPGPVLRQGARGIGTRTEARAEAGARAEARAQG